MQAGRTTSLKEDSRGTQKMNKDGRVYPVSKKIDPDGRGRPVSICVKCNQPVVLSWGKGNIPCWRHTKGRCRLDDSQRDTITHNLAKDLLISYLSKGYAVEVIQKCPNAEPRIYKLKGEQEAISEWTYGRCRFDIGCCGAADLADDFAIEICHTHQTTNVVPRQPVDWIEINADELLDVLDQQATPKKIKVRNIRSQCTEPSCVSCMSFDELLIGIGILRLEHSTFRDRRDEEKCWLIDQDKLNEIEENKFGSNVPLPKISLWTELISRGRCAHCQRKCIISLGKPYCERCLKKMIVASEDGESCVFGDLFEAEGSSVRDNSIIEYLTRIFNGNTILSSDSIKLRKAKKPITVFIASPKLQQMYLNWSGLTTISIKKIASVIEHTFPNVMSYVGHVTIDSKNYSGFHILEHAWKTVRIAHRLSFNRVEILPLDVYVSKSDERKNRAST